MRLSALTKSKMVRYGAAKEATPPSQAALNPAAVSKIGSAQHEATPNAAAIPPKVNRAAPRIRAGSTVLREFSDIDSALSLLGSSLTVCSDYRLKHFFKAANCGG